MAAAATPPITTTIVTESGSTTPLPTALATAVPDKAPRKFIPPAMVTATNGDITRVDTTVAMAFAASLNPFAKSKASAIKITAIRKVNDVGSITGQNGHSHLPRNMMRSDQPLRRQISYGWPAGNN